MELIPTRLAVSAAEAQRRACTRRPIPPHTGYSRILTRCVRQTPTVRSECWGEVERGRLGLNHETRVTAVQRNEIDASDVRAVRRHNRFMPRRDPVTIGGPVESACDSKVAHLTVGAAKGRDHMKGAAVGPASKEGNLLAVG